MTTDTRTIKKGDTVYRAVRPEDSDYGVPFTVRMVRTTQSRYGRERVHVFLKGEDTATWSTLIHAEDVTPEQAESFAAAVAAREAKAKADKERSDRLKAHYREAKAAFLAAHPEIEAGPVYVGPFQTDPSKSGGVTVGHKWRYYVLRGGLDRHEDFTPYTAEERTRSVSATCYRESDWDMATDRNRYWWAVRMGEHPHSMSPEQARYLAEALTRAADLIPSLGDPRPSYDPD